MSSLRKRVYQAPLNRLGNRLGHCVGIGLGLLAAGCIIFPPKIHYNSYMQPSELSSDVESYRTEEDGSVSYVAEGLRVNVDYLSDAELNALLPEDSQREEYSTNPYTYGDEVEGDVGYVPNRFSVFRVSVFNQTFAKVEFDPLEVDLLTDQGESLHAYGIPSTSPNQSFERYYRGLRGQSGNEFYRFEVRMGHVRSLGYAEDQPIFKGESYSGLIVFDTLNPQVKKVRFVLPQFALKFDEFDRVIESIDCHFDFDRHIEKWTVEEHASAGSPSQ
ncbi:uncharacterized protein METZ01_LOCUS151686 [marine metagenome]|uniref:Uncharacterized protein n=1 Tax=marine metagenome TaxID=408172 RepID=A0A382ACM2_9ZZZZ